MGSKKVGEFTTGKRLVVFEKPKDLYSFELGTNKNFAVRFRAVERGQKCLFVGSHMREAPWRVTWLSSQRLPID